MSNNRAAQGRADHGDERPTLLRGELGQAVDQGDRQLVADLPQVFAALGRREVRFREKLVVSHAWQYSTRLALVQVVSLPVALSATVYLPCPAKVQILYTLACEGESEHHRCDTGCCDSQAAAAEKLRGSSRECRGLGRRCAELLRRCWPGLWPRGLGSERRVGEDRGEQTDADLDEQRAEPHAVRSESIAPSATDPLRQAMGAELAQVVTKLTEGVVVLAEAVPSHDAFVQLPRRPVPEQAAGVQQVVEQSDKAVVMQLDAGDAARPHRHRGGQRRQCAAIHGGIEQFGLLGKVAVGRGGQVLLDRRLLVELASDREMVGVAQAGLGAQQPVALLVLLDVGALVVGPQHREAFIRGIAAAVGLIGTGVLLATVWSDVPANAIDFGMAPGRVQVGKTFDLGLTARPTSGLAMHAGGNRWYRAANLAKALRRDRNEAGLGTLNRALELVARILKTIGDSLADGHAVPAHIMVRNSCAGAGCARIRRKSETRRRPAGRSARIKEPIGGNSCNAIDCEQRGPKQRDWKCRGHAKQVMSESVSNL